MKKEQKRISDKYIKVIEWEEGTGFFNMLTNWAMMIAIAIFYPILYIYEKREVYYIKEKGGTK